ncbi:MAG: glycosyltransferase [Candidatus Hydrogenedentota bacterium]
MRPRILLLAREQVLHWVPLYRAAFARAADLITAGPALDTAFLDQLGRSHLQTTHTPNDIVTDADAVAEIAAQLPPGWRPDLVVALQSAMHQYRDIAALTCPTAYISVDTWHDSEEFRATRAYDFVFAAQRVFLPYLAAGGAARVDWLPLACDPAVHYPDGAAADHDIAFAGSLKYVVNQERIRRLYRLRERFSVFIKQDVGGDDLCRAFARGKLAFNSAISCDVNMRVFEVLAMGRPLLMNRDAAVNGLFDLFEDGRHLITYGDDNLEQQARRYLEDDAARAAIAKAGREAVHNAHTYDHRVAALLDHVRAAIPAFGEPQTNTPLLRTGGRLVDHLPSVPGHVLDIGLGLERSKLALRRRGVERLEGVGRDAAQRERRARSYDAVHAWPLPEARQAWDTVLWTAPFGYIPQPNRALDEAAHLLRDGGLLVLRLAPEEVRAARLPLDPGPWDRWLYTHRFHLVHFEPPAEGQPWLVLAGRRYSRTLRGLTDAVYQRFPIPEEDPNITLPPESAW